MVAVKRGMDFDRPLLNERPVTSQRKRKNGAKDKESQVRLERVRRDYKAAPS